MQEKEQYVVDLLSSREAWRVFRILAELVDGFETLSELNHAVSIFGSSRVKPGSPEYLKAVEISRLLAKEVLPSYPVAAAALWKRPTKELPKPGALPWD